LFVCDVEKKKGEVNNSEKSLSSFSFASYLWCGYVFVKCCC